MRKILLFFLLFTPTLVSARVYILPSGLEINIEKHTTNVIWKEFVLPSGLKYVAQSLIPIVKGGDITQKEEIEIWIKSYADKYGVPADQLLNLAKCESGFNIEAYNPKDPQGGAFGLYQYLKPTFEGFKKEAKKPELEYKNWKHQVELTAWAWSKGYQNHWKNCWNFQKYKTWNKKLWK